MITQRDIVIAELREMLATQEQSKSRYRRDHTVQASQEQISMSWEILSSLPVNAIGSVVEHSCTSNRQHQLPDPPLQRCISLASIKTELTIVGGCFKNRWGNFKDSDKLYSYVEGKWVEKYPPCQPNDTLVQLYMPILCS